jgi:hypothetical protein
MKTIAARFDETLFEALALVANLEETSIVDQIRIAVEAHIARKLNDEGLAARVKTALDDIDREAEARKSAIGALIGEPRKTPAKGRSRKTPPAEPQAQLSQSGPIGYTAPLGRRSGSAQ